MQHIVQHAAGVELARRLEEDIQHLQVGTRSGGRLPGGELAQELLRRAGGRAVRAEQNIRRALHAEFNVIVATQLAPVDPLAVDEGAVAAALVENVDAIRLFQEMSMLARDARIGHDQVAIGATANGKGEVIEHQSAAVRPFHHHQHLRIAGRRGFGFAQPHASSAH